jgi:hypothetical protein
MSTIAVPTAADVGAYSTEVANAAAVGKNYDARVAQKLIDVAAAAKADIEALEGGSFGSTVIPVANIDTRAGIVHSVRGVVTTNVASLSAFTVATHDGLTFVEGDRVLLAKQTTGAQDGIYVVGVVDAGAAPLTRAADWAAAAVLPANSMVVVGEGTVWKNSRWFASVAGAVTVATTSPAFYPERVKGTTAAMTGGTIDVTNTWILSATASVATLTAKTPGGTQGTLSYGTLTAGAGSGSFTITSSSNTDTSTVSYVIEN